MKNLFGQANKGLGKLKGFIFGSSSTEETSSASSEEPNQKVNPNPSQKPEPNKSPAKDDSKSNTIIKSSKGQFDFSEEDDEEDSKTKKNQSESESKDKNFEYSEPEEDYWRIAHRLYLKNSMVDIEPLPYVPFIKVKKNDNILSLIGFGKKNQFKEIKYFAVFDEHFLYMINMTTKDNNQNNFFKKIGNHYDLTKISNIEIKDDEVLENKKSIKLVFLLDNDSNNFSTIEKELHFEKNDAKKFFEILKFYLKKYDVPLIFQEKSGSNKEGTEDKDDEDEEEEEEDDEEEENDKKENKNDNKDNKNKDKDENSKIEEDKKEKREIKEEKQPISEEQKENIDEVKKDNIENKEDNKDKEVKKEENNIENEKKEEGKDKEKKEDITLNANKFPLRKNKKNNNNITN